MKRRIGVAAGLAMMASAAVLHAASPASPAAASGPQVRSLIESAEKLRTTGDLKGAVRDADAAVAAARQVKPLDEPLLADAIVQRCDVEAYIDTRNAERLCTEALEIRQRVLGPDARPTLNLVAQQAVGHMKDDPGSAAATLKDAADKLDRLAVDPQSRADAADTRAAYAMALSAQGKISEALEVYRAAIKGEENATDVGRGNAALYWGAMASILLQQGRVEEAIAASQAAFATHLRYHEAGHPDLISSRSQLGNALIQAGRYAEAEAQLRDAVAAVDKAEGIAPAFRARAYQDLGRFLVRTGRARAAEPLFTRALEIRKASKSVTAGTKAGAFVDLAECLRAQGRPAEARLLVLQAQEVVKAATVATQPPSVRSRLAIVELEAGNKDAAQVEADAAVATLAVLPDAQAPLAEALLTQGVVSRARGDLAEARIALTRAEALLRSRPARDPNRLQAETELGRTLLDGGDAAAAQPMVDAAVSAETALALDRSRLPGFGGVAASAEPRGVFYLALDLAWARGDPAHAARPLPDPVFAAAQMAITSRAAVALSASASRLAAADPELGRLMRARQDANEAFARADDALAAARALEGSPPAQLVEAAARARSQLEAADKALDVRFPAYRDLVGGAPLTVRQAQALLASDEAMLLILPTPSGVYQLVLRKDAAQWSRSPYTAAKVHAAFAALRASLDPATAVRGLEDASGVQARLASHAFPRSVAHELYQGVWADSAPALRGAQTVYVATVGDLLSLPLAVLVADRPAGEDGDGRALGRTAWLARRHALVTLPSVANLRALRAAAPGGVERAAFTGFGDPALGAAGGSTQRSAASDIQPGDLPSLPGARAELQFIAKALGAPSASLHLQADATEAAVKRADLAHVRVVAFATHGLLAGDLPAAGEPALVFTPPAKAQGEDDGFLTASEAARLTLNSDWVVLSACNTAGPDGSPDGEGLSGLTRAFFYAGAPAVLASHWRVRDDAAGAVTVAALERYARRPAEGRARALQAAMLKVLDDGRPGHADPSVWAPFVLVGDGR